ncbi:hypothetical protein [Celeribacter marinus]|uniref:hypothetical protein n=1 Tax=Celeribacter marinus TaxID=1397108 RepID=UPI00318236C2
MIHDPVEDFVRRAAGMMRLFDDVDQYRVAIRPGGPSSRASGEPLPERAKVTAPDFELIDAGAVASAKYVNMSEMEFSQPDLLTFDPMALAPIEFAFGATLAAEDFVQAGQMVAANSLQYSLYRLARHGEMVQRDIEVNQSNVLDDRDTIGDGVSRDMGIGIEGTLGMMSLARTILDVSAASEGSTVMGIARPVTFDADIEGAALLTVDGNIMSNSAVVVQSGVEIGLLAIMGDAHISTTLMQLNILDDGGHNAGASQNIVRQVDLPAIPFLPVTAAPDVSLSLTVIDGDFLDIMRITQTQIFDDRDVIGWSETSEHLQLASGGNVGGNATFYGLTDWNAEIVIVEGDYIAQREIIQANLADDADVFDPANSDFDDASGGTNLRNSAAIALPADGDSLGEISDELASFIAAISSGDAATVDDLAKWDADGDGRVEALLVRGDFIDVKSIRQVNILADADVVLGIPAKRTPLETEPVTLFGTDNSLSNDAVLIDATSGARTSVLAGQIYDNTLLLDANLLGDTSRGFGAGQFDIGGAAGTSMDVPPAALSDAILFDAPTWGI